MRVSIEKVYPSTEGVWTAHIDPQSLIRLANPIRQGGRINIIMVSRPLFDSLTHSLQFDLDSAILLNLGNTAEAVFVDSRENESSRQLSDKPFYVRKQLAGDLHFLEELKRLPQSQRIVGEKILAAVRKEYPGDLIFHEKSKKFVESPDNFWVVLIQPRVKSLRIIVYGKPEEYRDYNNIKLKDDMKGYSSFLIDNINQINDAVNIILEAKQLKDKK